MSPNLRIAFPALFAAVAVLGSPAVGHAAIQVLQNDGFVENGTVGFQSGFVTGERGAVTLGPVAEAFQINKVQLLFGPSGGPETVNLIIYLDPGGNEPGTLLFEGEFDIQPAEDAISELDISAEGIQVAGGSIRVALEFQHDGAPSIARDDDGISAGRNWIYFGGNWFDSEDLGLTGDWIIRAEIDTLGGGTVASTATGTGSSTGTGDVTTGTGTGSSGATTGPGGTTGVGPGAGGSSGVCAPGATQVCVGPASCAGGQSCLADGTGWSTCECGEVNAAGAGGGDAAEDGGDEGCGCIVPGATSPRGAATFAGAALLAALALARKRPRR